MQLPFLKEFKRPRVAKPEEGMLRDEKLINGSQSDNIDAHCASELIDAYKAKNPSQFRAALNALIMNMLEEPQNEPDAA